MAFLCANYNGKSFGAYIDLKSPEMIVPLQDDEPPVPLSEVKIEAPIKDLKRNMVCLGKNYKAHAKELQDTLFAGKELDFPIYFTKGAHTIIGPDDIIPNHKITKKLDYEVELAVIIGRSGINIKKEEAKDYIFGYTIANDISARDLQVNHTQWFKGKNLVGYCPMGPYIIPVEDVEFPVNRRITCHVNGELRQDGNTSDLIFSIPEIIEDLSRGYPLFPGDIILTGTPAGVGMGFDPPKFLKPGDKIVCEIEGFGKLSNVVGD